MRPHGLGARPRAAAGERGRQPRQSRDEGGGRGLHAEGRDDGGGRQVAAGVAQEAGPAVGEEEEAVDVAL